MENDIPFINNIFNQRVRLPQITRLSRFKRNFLVGFWIIPVFLSYVVVK